ncbi:MAG: hypothetical protein ACRDJE_14850 [Dehalococcoidia bacterium]
MNKHDVIAVMEAMPEEFDLDELVYRLRLKQKLEASERALAEGRVLTHEEVVRRSQAWFR